MRTSPCRCTSSPHPLQWLLHDRETSSHMTTAVLQGWGIHFRALLCQKMLSLVEGGLQSLLRTAVHMYVGRERASSPRDHEDSKVILLGERVEPGFVKNVAKERLSCRFQNGSIRQDEMSNAAGGRRGEGGYTTTENNKLVYVPYSKSRKEARP